MEYRSKIELSGDVRIVEIDGVDKCACCAPHVRRTGEIGAIHIKSHIKYKKGTRLTIVCGEWAINDYMSISDTASKLSRDLSAPTEEIYDAFMKKEDTGEKLFETVNAAWDGDYIAFAEDYFRLVGDIVAKTEAEPGSIIPTISGRNFAVSGGVAESVRLRLHNPEKLKPAVINGLNKAGMKQLAQYGKIHSGEVPHTEDCPNLIEVMACEGGCIAGPSVITNPRVAAIQLKKYVEAGASDTINK